MTKSLKSPQNREMKVSQNIATPNSRNESVAKISCNTTRKSVTYPAACCQLIGG